EQFFSVLSVAFCSISSSAGHLSTHHQPLTTKPPEEPALPDELPPANPPVGPSPPTNGNGDRHEPLNIEDELKNSYLTYAMSVIVSRAFPAVRDGLKPSQRRTLLAMNDLGLGPTAATSNCA